MASWGRLVFWARIAFCTSCLLGVFTASAFGATYSVTSTADDSGAGTCSPVPATCTSLRQAINTIDASGTAGVINVAPGDYLLTEDVPLNITANMTINGAGPGTGSGATTIDGNGNEVFEIDGAGPTSVALTGMNVQGDTHTDSPAIDFEASNTATLTLSRDAVINNLTSDVDGGGIFFEDNGDPGELDITDTTIAGNIADCCANGAGIAFENGPVGTLIIDGSTLSGNDAGSADGGGIYFDGGTASISNSTISGNTAEDGAGLYLADAATTLTNDTIAGNVLSPTDTEAGAGIFGAGTIDAVNTIVSGNNGGLAGANDCDAHVKSSDHSLEDGTDCGFDLPSGDPKLQPLADNGGLTQTMALSPGSAAIDAGDKATCLATDQRGFARPDVAGTACDVGAYEYGGPPTASITMPANGATFTLGEVVDASYGCSPGTDGTLKAGATGCAGPVANDAAIDTSTGGVHSFTVTATDADGQTSSTTNSYTVSAPPSPGRPVNILPPSIAGTPKAGDKLACSNGTWTNSPTGYSVTWSRNTTPIAGATRSTYTVQVLDLGSTLSCTVAASNAAGAGSPATSKGIAVPVPAHCPLATGQVSGPALGLVRLGMTRAQARRAFVHSSDRGKKYEDFFCLTPIGVRVGYASPKLLSTLPAKQRERLAGRVVWASTANPYYALDGVRPGASVATASSRLRLERPFHIGLNFWYLAPNGNTTAVLKVRHGIVEEIGIALKSLTIGRKAQRRLMKSFS